MAAVLVSLCFGSARTRSRAERAACAWKACTRIALARCEALRHVDSLQPPFSVIRREVAAAEIPWCVEHGTGVLAYSPMQSGLLTDSFTADRAKSLKPAFSVFCPSWWKTEKRE